jgi:hypothetical protein
VSSRGRAVSGTTVQQIVILQVVVEEAAVLQLVVREIVVQQVVILQVVVKETVVPQLVVREIVVQQIVVDIPGAENKIKKWQTGPMSRRETSFGTNFGGPVFGSLDN